MDFQIRSLRNSDVESLIQISLLAWLPVYKSFKQILGDRIYTLLWPAWQTSQREAVERVCRESAKSRVLVAELQGLVVGFVAYALNSGAKTAEVKLLAVHPDYQNGGIGTELVNVALRQMQEQGIKLAIVETGADPSHAPARKVYEKAGYTGFPIVRYFKDLQ